MTTPLLCLLGLHRPGDPPVWNAGNYFSRCARCSRDLIKPVAGRWRVPRGFRIVWKTPAEAALAILLRDLRRARGPSGPQRPHVPLQDVLRRLRQTDFMQDERVGPEWDREIEVRVGEALGRMDRTDFMASSRSDLRVQQPPSPAGPPVPLPRGAAGS